METKFVYSFNEGSKDMRDRLGGKGANLAEMTKIGLPVPFGFTVTTEACRKYYEDGEVLDPGIEAEIRGRLEDLENVSGKTFGDPEEPLLVSVRSGAPISMPGMMDTILNLGLNDETVRALARMTKNERFAMDSYRRLLQMYGNVVYGIDMKKFDDVFDGRKKEVGAKADVDLTAEDLREIIRGYHAVYRSEHGADFPQDPWTQLIESVTAVFRSWGNERAVLYRKLNDIPNDLGTAVNVQQMVFGNKGDQSGTGVAFTRNPATGEKGVYGEFLVNAQGEDVVAGIRTPRPISEMAQVFPDAYQSFVRICEILEKHYKDMQDMEFTVEDGRLFMLQTRTGKRTAQAAVKIAVDMVGEELIDTKTAVLRIEPEYIEHLMHPRFDDEKEADARVIARGIAASPGAASGEIVFDVDDAVALKKNGRHAILVRQETSPEDLAGMLSADGILTAHGGATSHAAVVARGMGKCCVTGCRDIVVDETAGEMTAGGKTYHKGDPISISGTNGNVYEGAVDMVDPDLSGDFATIMGWVDKFRTMKVRTNADTPKDARQAVQFGAEGIGLCRTEHMFFQEDRIPAIREMIIADTQEERKTALAKLLPFQESDFEGIFEAMEDRPVTIRLLDPPLHEFLPTTDEEFAQLAKESGIPVRRLKERAESLREFNPMLGTRGCRLVVLYPEIAEMQTEAIVTAAIRVSARLGFDIRPEIMIPLAGSGKELAYVCDIVRRTADRVMEENGKKLDYLVGTMIEVPRAALTADEIAKHAQFFSFGTNDLTQMTFGFSRDDTAKLIDTYVEKALLDADPFRTIDQEGVGKLMKIAVKLGRKTRPTLKLGICGEHGGDPKSVEFCHRIGLNYVSCSPYRVPIARLAAAQAAIRGKQEEEQK